MNCVVCGWTLPRRWWQRWILTPLPVCKPDVTAECRQRAGLPPVSPPRHP